MKKITITLLIILGTTVFTSCYSTISATAYSDYLTEMDNIAIQLNKLGYELSGKANSTSNNVYVSDVSFSTETGYGTAMKNNYVTTDKYTFTDSVGNNLFFEVSYKLYHTKDNKSICYITNENVPQCSTTNPKDYHLLCGPKSPIYNVTNAPKSYCKIYNEEETVWAICFSLLLATVIALIKILDT